jgi:hypothetical protein
MRRIPVEPYIIHNPAIAKTPPPTNTPRLGWLLFFFLQPRRSPQRNIISPVTQHTISANIVRSLLTWFNTPEVSIALHEHLSANKTLTLNILESIASIVTLLCSISKLSKMLDSITVSPRSCCALVCELPNNIGQLDFALKSTVSLEDAQQHHTRLEHEVVDLTSDVSAVGKIMDEGRQKLVGINAHKKSFHDEIREVLFHNQSLMTSLNSAISKLLGSEAISSTTDAVSIGSESEPLMSVKNTRVDDQDKRSQSEAENVLQMLQSLMDKFDATKIHTASNHDLVTALQNELKQSRQELLITKDLLRDALQNVSHSPVQIETLTEVQRSVATRNGRLAEENNRWRDQMQEDQILLQEEKDEVERQQGLLAHYQRSLMEKKFKLQDEETKLRNKQHELDRRAEDIQKTSFEFLEMENSLKERQKSLTAWAFRLHLREATVHEKELALRTKEEQLKPGHTVTDSDSQMKASDMSCHMLHSGDQKPDIVGYTHTTSGPQLTVPGINKVRFCFPFLCK